MYIGRRPCRIRLRGLPIYTAKRTPCRNVVWLFWDMCVNWHPILCHLSDILVPVDIQFNTNPVPMECHLTANGVSLDCQSNANWLPILCNLSYPIQPLIKFDTVFFWLCILEESRVKFDSEVFLYTQPKEPRVKMLLDCFWIFVSIDIQYYTTWVTFLYQLTSNLIPIDCQWNATWIPI